MSMAVSQELAKIFEAIDTDYNGYITRNELESYAKKTGQPDSMVDDWFKWFDYGNTGKITYEDLCETLAISMTKTYAENVEKKRELIQKEGVFEPVQSKPPEHEAPNSANILDGVKVLFSGSTKPGLLEYIVKEVKSTNLDNFERESQFARYLKETMDKKWGPHWQVVVSKSTFGCSVGHEEEYFTHFHYGPYLYILYRTPE